VLAKHPSSARIYLRPDGGAPQAGDHIALHDLAATLEAIADQGAAGFYRGPVAQNIVNAVQAAGGRMTMEDLAGYRALEREPVAGTYRGYAIVSMSSPSSGGAHIIEILNILEGYPLSEQGLNSAASLHEMAEAGKARLRRPRGLSRRSRLRQNPACRAHFQSLRRASALAHFA
jgi:gamma-glutamyltranspeptidase/glutathione hydrolase